MEKNILCMNQAMWMKVVKQVCIGIKIGRFYIMNGTRKE